MEKFFGMKGWAEKPEYDFIIDPTLNQSYMQKMSMTDQMTRQQGVLELESLEAQTEAMEMQTQMQEQQMQQPDPAMMQQQPGMPPEGDPSQMAAPEEQDPNGMMPEDPEAQKSLRDVYLAHTTPLQKSMETYFGSWIKAHNHISEDDL